MTNGNRSNIFPMIRTVRLPLLALALLAVLLAAMSSLQPQPAQAQDEPAVCDRTQQVSYAIVKAVKETRNSAACGNISMGELARITELTVNGYSPSAIVPGDFANLVGLETLAIHNSAALVTVPANAFAHARSVTTLDLRGNAINALHRDAFRHLSRLTTLNLGINHIDYLPEGVFRHLSTLEDLHLHSNYLDAIEDDRFAGLSSLTAVDLSDNKLSEINTAAFHDTTLLQELSLGGNSLAPVNRDTLGMFTNLTALRLNNTGITLAGDTFWSNTALTTLDLSDNELSSLPAPMLAHQGSLEALLLQDNELTSLPNNFLANNTFLSHLNLSGNELSSLDANLFAGLQSLGFVFLHDNNLTALPNGLFSDPGSTLQRLTLHDNDISSLHQDIFDGLDQLGEITLRNNDLTTLHVDVFNDTVCLGELDLRDNGITSSGLPATVFDSLGGCLFDLRLGGNSLSSLPSGLFTGLAYLETLDLSRNGLTALDLNELDPFADSLTYLDLSGNSFTTAPTDAAIEAKLTAIEEFYVTTDSPTGIVDSITISGGTVDFETPPRNSRFEIRYTATAPYGADSLTINLNPRDSGAAVTRTDDSEDSYYFDNFEFNLYDRDLNTPGIQVGAPLSRRNVIEFEVDGYEYVIDLQRDASSKNARLADLTLSDATLSPDFDGLTLDYLGFAHWSVSSVTVSATPERPGATVVVKDDGVVVGGNGIVQHDQAPAEQVITVEVTAEDGVTTQTYRVEMAAKAWIVAPESMDEDGLSHFIAVRLNKRTARAATITLRISHPSRATWLFGNDTALIPAGGFISGPVELEPVDNDHWRDFQLRISGRVIDNPDVHNPDDVFITIVDDDFPIPDTPANFRVSSEAGKTTFAWDDVTVPEHASRVRYDIFVRTPGGSDDDWVFLSHTGIFEGSVDASPLTERRLPAGGTYEFAMRAVSMTGKNLSGGEGGIVLGALTAPIEHTVLGPNRPLDLWAQRTGDGVGGPVKLTWQPPPLYPWIHDYLPSVMPVPDPNVDTSVTGYTIYRAEEPADDGDISTPWDQDATYSALATVGNVLTYTDNTASDDKGYFYRVEAVSPDGISDHSGYGFVYPVPSNDDEFDLSGSGYLPYPENLRAAAGAESIELTWDDVALATGYVVFRRSPDAGYYVQIATTTAGSYTDSDVEVGETYGYLVKSVNDKGISLPSGAVESMILPPPPPLPPLPDPPSAPTGLQASVGDGSVTLTWTASDDDTVAGYVVFREVRNADPPEEPTHVGTVDAATTEFTDTGVEPGASYTYSVEAYNLGGASEPVTVDVDIPSGDSLLREGDSTPPSTGPVTGFTLVDASDQNVLATLSDGVSVELEDPSGGSYGIRADVDSNVTIGSVSLALSGDKTVSRTENVAPYSLYGDGGANALNGEALPAGSYTLTATAYAGSGLTGDVLGTLEVSFTVTAPAAPQETPGPLTGFTLVDASDQAVLATLTGGESVELADPDGGSYGIRIDVDANAAIGSVKLELSGEKTVARTENVAPYSLYGDGGANALNGEALPAGSYTLTATAYAGSNLNGDQLGVLQVSFTVAADLGPLTGFTLVDASDQTVLATLTDGTSVALADPDGGSYGIRVDVDSNASIGSVKLELSGEKAVTRTENVAPYSLYGDGGTNALNGQALPAGSYTLTATAYSGKNLGGNELGVLEVSFTITASN